MNALTCTWKLKPSQSHLRKGQVKCNYNQQKSFFQLQFEDAFRWKEGPLHKSVHPVIVVFQKRFCDYFIILEQKQTQL